MESKLYSLSQDLLKLYCKTKNSKIEDLYLRIAANVSFYDLDKKLRRWRVKSNQLKLGQDILSALEWIYDWFAKPNYGDERNPLALQDAKGRLNDRIVLQIIPALEKETSGPFGTLLSPATGFLKSFIKQATATHEKIDSATLGDQVREDLTTLQNWLIKEGTEQESTPEEKAQQAKMYTALIGKFTEDLTKAFQNAVEAVGGVNAPQAKPYMDILVQIRQGALADANKFSGVLDLPLNQLMYNEAEEVVDSVLVRYTEPYLNQNAELIKKRALSFVGAQPKPPAYVPEINEQGYAKPALLPEQVRQDPSKGKFPSYTPTAEDFQKDQERRKTTVIPDEQWMSPSVIAMLCVVFNVMRKKIYGKRE